MVSRTINTLFIGRMNIFVGPMNTFDIGRMYAFCMSPLSFLTNH